MAENISDMIVDKMVADLETGLAASVEPDETVGVTRGGHLQANPVKARLYALVHINDPDNADSWADVSLASDANNIERRSVSAAPFEVGGGSMMWRRFTVEFGLFAIKSKEDRDEARRIANAVKGRIERIIKQQGVTGLTDSEGEISIQVIHASSMVEEGGGPKASFIWRGKVRFQVLTASPF